MMRTSCLAIGLLFACTATVPESGSPGGDDSGGVDVTGDVTGLGSAWTSVGYGVAYQRVNAGDAIVIAYGGYTAKLAYSAAWASELVDARLGAAEVGQIYAVQGPEDPGYDAKEIGNSKLRRHLATIDDGASPIYVIAHSSGSYVAHELLDQLYAAGTTGVLSRIHYACLEGGGAGLDDAIVGSLAHVEFVYAHDPTLDDGYSENHAAELELAAEYAPNATSAEVSVPSTGCDDGAGWCLHDVVVTHRPHDPDSFDLADDYTDFTGRPLTTEYLDAWLPQD
ncbi:MAG TPA: hypothetical protein VLX92_22175 [Kofleriaceae bacterium]|nr:hypothetical protein [Kofleriaceae bacterium]